MTTNGQHPGGRDLLSECLIEHNLDGVLAVDRDCRCTIWNPAMERMSGVGAEHAIGRRVDDAFPCMRDASENRQLSDALAGAVVVSRDRPFVVPATGRRGYFDGHYSPLRDSSGAIVGSLGIIRDITARRAFEDEHARVKAELADVQVARATGRAARNVAHDFNNLFTVILGNVEMLLPILDRLDDEVEDTLRHGLNTVQVASHRAAMLARQLLTVGPDQGRKAARSERGDVVEAAEEKVILVCDDQDSVRQVTCEILRRSGYTVVESSSARAALEAAAALERETDLLITDLIMPDMNGQELAAEMAKLQPSARLLYISGRAPEELDGLFEPTARQDFLQKPFTSRTLLQRVRALLN